MKICNTCGKERPISSFYRYDRGGKPYTPPRCIDCCREAAMRSHEKKIRQKSPLIDKKREARLALNLAREKGEKYYYSSVPCKASGHVGRRLVSTQQCCACLKAGKAKARDSSGAKSHKRSAAIRRMASAMGRSHYVTGQPCIRGHVAERLVSTRQCVECLKERRSKRPAIRLSPEAKRRANAKKRKRAAKIKQRKYQSEVLMKNPDYLVRRFMYESIRRSLSEAKSKKTDDLLGYTGQDLRRKIEYGFVDGMSWGNYGEWHIDHKIPISYWVSKGETRAHIINSLSNLQPMWAADNIAKSNKWNGCKQRKDFEPGEGLDDR